ncbi:MAG: RNA polymerase sporulation sigma factor SigH [Clostridia bacterium]|nr:RNA polymerase sporulation sigma factor SigH [Clostridia bacterium]
MDNNSMYFCIEKYKDVPDEELIKKIKMGEADVLEYLIEKYRKLVNLKVCKYYIIGAEKEDIVQEGLIGLYKAIKDFDGDKQNSFKSFANMCIERQLITAIKTSNRQKHIPLNSYVSLNTSAYDEDEDTPLIEVFNSKTIEDPLETLTKKEYYEDVERAIEDNLSKFEKKVLSGYVNGESYVKMAQRLDAPVKSIDNAIQRIRKKAIKNMVQ